MRFPADRLDPAGYPTFVDIPVLYGDLDTNAHVNNVMMGRFFEHARYSTLASVRAGVPDLAFLVARVAIDYLSEGKIGSVMRVGSRLARVGTTSLTIEQAAWQGGDRTVALCETVLVRIADGRPAPLPERLQELAPTALPTPTA